MNRKIILPICLMLLVGIAGFVYAWAGEGGAPIHKGWNLVYGFISPEQLNGQYFEAKHIKAVYGFIPQNQEYLRLYPNPVEKEKAINQLSQQAFWVYSNSETGEDFNGIYNAVEYWLYDKPIPFNERQMYKGWNFVGISGDIIGSSLNDIKGSCNIEKAYFWNPEEQKWDSLLEGRLLDNKFNRDILGLGIVVKVSNNCKLGTSEGTPPSVPNLP